MECTCHITGGHKKDDICFAESFFDPINDLDPEKKIVDLHMFNVDSVCRKAIKVEGCISYYFMYFCIRTYLS